MCFSPKVMQFQREKRINCLLQRIYPYVPDMPVSEPFLRNLFHQTLQQYEAVAARITTATGTRVCVPLVTTGHKRKVPLPVNRKRHFSVTCNGS